jgi:hypothetical protein
MEKPHGMMSYKPITKPYRTPYWVHITLKIGEIYDISSTWMLLLQPVCQSPKVGQN